jgi:hypothetical protein
MINWGWGDEYDLPGNMVLTVDLCGDCEFNFTPGSPAIGPRYDHGGIPADPPEIEYFNFKAHRLAITIWGDSKNPNGSYKRQVIYRYDGGPGERWNTEETGKWFEKMVENDDSAREELDEKVNDYLEKRNEPEYDTTD